MEVNEPMRYRRADTAGGSYFFTVNLADRQSDLLVRHIEDSGLNPLQSGQAWLGCPSGGLAAFNAASVYRAGLGYIGLGREWG